MKNLWSQEKYIRAIRFAAKAHLGQKYPGTDAPYLLHLSMVSMEIMTALTNETDLNADLALQSAILHDVIEDTSVNYEQIGTEFGIAVADGVLALSKNMHLEKEKRMTDCLHRIREQPREIWMVKMADRISNLDTPPHYWSSEKISEYRKEARQIYDALSPASVFLGKRLKTRIETYQNWVVGQIP